MKLGILLCDHVHTELQPAFGDYPEMFHSLFANLDSNINLEFYDVTKNEYPNALNSCDGYLTSGSRRSVYEDVDWLPELSNFIMRLYRARIPLVGICFGHQLIAQIFSGKVLRSEKGWGIGLQSYHVHKQKNWMSPTLSKINLIASHQDQVIQLPKNAEILASNEFCPYAMFQIDQYILGIQAHPEFCHDYSLALMEFRRETIPDVVIKKARVSLAQSSNSKSLAHWLINFINQTK